MDGLLAKNMDLVFKEDLIVTRTLLSIVSSGIAEFFMLVLFDHRK